MRYFVTADLHLGHKRIILFERTQFATVPEHDKFVINSINSAVLPTDMLYILGDVGFVSADHSLEKLIKQVNEIKCHKILVRGNHDKFNDFDARRMGFEQIYGGPVYFSAYGVDSHIILSHEPVKEAYDNPYIINVHGHIHNGQLTLPNFYNVNIARTDYKPIDLAAFVRIARNCKARRECFGREWYYDYYNLKYPEERQEDHTDGK